VAREFSGFNFASRDDGLTMSRPRILRLLRIAFSAGCGIACLLLLAWCVRSYASHDGIWGRISRTEGFHLSAHEGRLQFNTIRNLGIIEWRFALGERIDTVRSPNYIPRFEYFQSGLGSFLAIPIWFLALLLATLAVILAIRPQFSVRTLLIATTLVAVVLGLLIKSSARN
jgi:hypothetical protein